jgi:tetratricopeptide (TPR) repeat protein
VWHRRELGNAMTAVDQVYAYVDRTFPNEELALWPGFLSYPYHLDAGKAIRERDMLESPEDLRQRHTPNKTLVISWGPSLWEQLDLVRKFSGCTTSLFDAVFPCKRAKGLFLMRYIGLDGDYQAAEAARAQSDFAGARKLYEAFLARHPANPAGYFVLGYEAYGLKDYVRAEEAYGWLEEVLPDHLPIVWNHALSLEGLGQFREAIPRLAFILEHDPRNYLAFMHLYWDYRRDGREGQARDLLLRMKLVTPRKPARGVPCGPSDVGRSPGVPLPHCARLSARLLY